VSVGVEVDALALMLDGAVNEWCHRFGRINLEFLIERRRYNNPPPQLERAAAMPEWTEVAEAILELEAWADYNDGCALDRPSFGPLAVAADRHVRPAGSTVDSMLEAAALLRDGWRPRKRSKR
jgi:hypothetical protein